MSQQSCATFGTLKPSSRSDEEAVHSDRAECPTPVVPPEEERTELAHYRIVRLLGRGGMGKVYEAEDIKLQRTVALKVMLPDMTAFLVCRERFLREARSMAAVRNDHIVTIY